MRIPIVHERAGMRLPASLKFERRMVIDHYTGILICVNLYGDKDLDRRFGERVVSVSRNQFQKYYLHISDDMKESNGKRHPAWTVTSFGFYKRTL